MKGQDGDEVKEAEHVESQSAETVMAIARLGGFMDSKRTGIASWGALW